MTPLYSIIQLIKDLYETEGKAKATGIMAIIIAIVVGLGVGLWAIAAQGL